MQTRGYGLPDYLSVNYRLRKGALNQGPLWRDRYSIEEHTAVGDTSFTRENRLLSTRSYSCRSSPEIEANPTDGYFCRNTA